MLICCYQKGESMNKVIKIEGENIYIGLDDGSILEAKKTDFNYSPNLNDLVEIYRNGATMIISRATGAYNPVGFEYTSTTGKQVVNKLNYCLLAFLLGGLGIHKFYANKIVTGVLYLLFCWTCIPMLIAFIEFIIALCQPVDKNGNILV